MNTLKSDNQLKRVLFISSPYFGYYRHIINELESQGYVVDYYNDRPSENSFIKGIIKVKKDIVDTIIDRYFERILKETKPKKYDIVFIMNGKVFTDKMIKQLRDSQKNARFLFYTWDAMVLYPNAKELIDLFDKAYSFDTDDCENFDKLNLLPLFYTRSFEKIGLESDNCTLREYDIVSVCTAHPNRYKTMSKLFPELESMGIRIFSYMFLNKLQYIYNRMFVTEFKRSKSKEFKFKPLTEQENLEALKKANTVFDMQHNKQSGLTMRTIETLGAKRKLITANKNIKKYDFYDENNIFVMDENNLSGIEQFIRREYEAIGDEIYKKYSLHSWIETIISEADNNYFR